MHKINGILLDVDYFLDEKRGICLRLYVKTKKGIEKFTDRTFKPYFYVIAKNPKKLAKELKGKKFNDAEIKDAKVVKKGNAENVARLEFKNTKELSEVREEIEDIEGVIEKREYDIPFVKRYMIDRSLQPTNFVSIEADEKNEIKKIKNVGPDKNAIDELNIGCFDIETYSKGSFSNSERDPIIMIAYKDNAGSKTFTFGKGFKEEKDLVVSADEAGMIKAFIEEVKKRKPDVIVTYNGDQFDFPYLNGRGGKLGLKIDFGFGEQKMVRKGLVNAVKLKGIQHLDAYQVVRLLARIGALNLVKFDLESVANAVLGKEKEKLKAEQINEIWEKKRNLERLVNYNKEDVDATLAIAKAYLPLIAEFSRLVKQTIFDVSRVSSGQLVEALLIAKSFENNNLIPNKPDEGIVKQRMMQTFKGGYVKEPLPGLHENIAVLDFRSLHPTIIISHNVSPETLKCEHKSCKNGENLSPDKDWFCEKERGFLPSILKEILEKRMEVKKEMERHEKSSLAYNYLNARQHALKILLNSFYGTLGYARFRWYSRESARAVTAWSRHYVRETIHKAEKAGFIVLYADTDSNFLVVPKGKSEKDVLDFVKKVNSELPGVMELEFEGFYKRGIFVTKREGGAAKKRYALVDFNNNLTIVGFEYVRRDWAVIAKDTQKEVIEAVLKEGKPEKAIGIIRKKVEMLKKGVVKKRDLIIQTQIQKPLKEYESIGPHIAAAKKALKRGKSILPGSLVEYIITKSGKSISDKAEFEEYVKEGNYDADYYIQNQLVPAVIKIMRELGYSEGDLIHGGRQKTLSSFS